MKKSTFEFGSSGPVEGLNASTLSSRTTRMHSRVPHESNAYKMTPNRTPNSREMTKISQLNCKWVLNLITGRIYCRQVGLSCMQVLLIGLDKAANGFRSDSVLNLSQNWT